MKAPPGTSDDHLIRDYYNEFAPFSVWVQILEARNGGVVTASQVRTAIRKGLSEHRVRTVEERYLTPDSGQACQTGDAIHRVIQEQPEKIAELNRMANIVNQCENIDTLKSACNRVAQLLYGEDRVMFVGKPVGETAGHSSGSWPGKPF